MPPPPRKLPNLFDIEERLNVVEKEFVRWLPEKGRIMRELSGLQEKVKELSEANRTRDAMSSSADISVRPGRLGMKLRLPPWAIVAIILVVAVIIGSVIALQAMPR